MGCHGDFEPEDGCGVLLKCTCGLIGAASAAELVFHSGCEVVDGIALVDFRATAEVFQGCWDGPGRTSQTLGITRPDNVEITPVVCGECG